MNRRSQDAAVAFVRRILSARIGEPITVDDRPEAAHRNVKVVEERWRSASHAYAVEHTRIEAFEGQIENSATVQRLLGEVKRTLEGRLHGRYVLRVFERETSRARVRRDELDDLHREIVNLVIQADKTIKPEETVTLKSDRLPFSIDLHLRHRKNTFVALYTDIDGDPDALRLEHVRRAFDQKCPKLLAWSGNGRTSVLVLESDDIQLSNAFVILASVKRVLAERNDHPDVIVLVETDGYPMQGHVFKDSARIGDDVPTPNGCRVYTEGEF